MNDSGMHIFGRPLGVVAVTVYKTLWGLSECASGLLLAFSGILINGELTEDPQDIFANWLLRSLHFDASTAAHVGALFFLLGSIKLLVALGIWFSSWKIRRALIIFLCVITAYAVVDLATHVSPLRIVALFSDLFILVYLWKFLPRHLEHDVF